jgi:DNA modification methylase
VISNALDLLAELKRILCVEWDIPNDLLETAQKAIDGCAGWMTYNQEEREKRLFALINSKLKLNKERFQNFLDVAAKERIILNYHDKLTVLEYFDNHDAASFKRWLEERKYPSALFDSFNPVTQAETLLKLHEQLESGAVTRRDARKCDVSERKNSVLRSLFGSYVFHSFPAQAMHTYFNPDSRKDYKDDFYQHLLKHHTSILHRDCSMIFLCIDEDIFGEHSYEEVRDSVLNFTREAYKRLANHCFFAVLIRPLAEGKESQQWRLFSDLILYAEKHREIPLKTGYFHPDDIAHATVGHVPDLDVPAARFDLANEGFFFRDCFVIAPEQGKSRKSRTTSDNVELLLLFEKNERDETVIPCPACRSKDVRGNSYPALGVRSWECQNPICPDRSAFDRGNRYSLSALIKQEAIKSENDQIPESSLKRWKLDVVFGVEQHEISDMLLQHFTLHGDTVTFVNLPNVGGEKHGRKIIYERLSVDSSHAGLYRQFESSAFFNRFLVDKKTCPSAPPSLFPGSDNTTMVYQGDCFEVLTYFDTESIDGAVTSPPYYNARSYTVWPNIYCYLYDMYNVAREVFRVLKAGGVYLFNIFDYFDNENSIVFSAMGKKRMILGAYIIHLFRRVGFELIGNVVWYKGEIEGKRNFNQGNRSPYYQFPFNCWEHILVFKKPGNPMNICKFPTILDAKPVVKIVKGKNVLGHSAPFPAAIPELLIDQLQEGQCVLDPFSGSMTTGRSAYLRGLRSVSIDLHREYCELGLRLLNKDRRSRTPPAFITQASLFQFEHAG